MMPFYMHPTSLCDEHFRLVEEVNAGAPAEGLDLRTCRDASDLTTWRAGVTAAYSGDITCIAGYLIIDADLRKMAQPGFEDADMCGGVTL